jgi:hypothetical protein
VLRDVDKLKKGARTLLDRYLARPAHDTVLVLVAPRARSRQGAERARRRWWSTPLTGDRLPRWVTIMRAHASAHDHPEAVTLLVEAVGGDLAQLAVELEKLASYCDRDDRRARVADVVGVRAGESLGDSARCHRGEGRESALGADPDRPAAAEDERRVDRDGTDGPDAALGFAEARSRRNGIAWIVQRAHGAAQGHRALSVPAVGRSVQRVDEARVALDAAEIDAALHALLAADAALKETASPLPSNCSRHSCSRCAAGDAPRSLSAATSSSHDAPLRLSTSSRSPQSSSLVGSSGAAERPRRPPLPRPTPSIKRARRLVSEGEGAAGAHSSTRCCARAGGNAGVR